MKKSIAKTLLLLASMAGLLCIVGCSQKPTNAAGTGTPQLVLAAGDILSPMEVATNADGRIALRFKLSETKADELVTFTQEHSNQQATVLIGTKPIVMPGVPSEISNSKGDIQVLYPAFEAGYAQEIAASLNKK